MPKVSDEHRAARRQQILDAATRCFASKGIDGASMQDLQAEAGLSAGALYSYFDSKDEIVEALADERHRRESELMRPDPDVPAQDQLAAIGASLMGRMQEGDGRLERLAGIQLWATALTNPRLKRIVRRGVDQPLAAMSEVIRIGQERGEIDPALDREQLARACIALFFGIVLQHAWDPEVDLDAYLGTVGVIAGRLAPDAAR